MATVFFVNGAVYGSWAARLPALRDNASLAIGELGLVLATAGAAAFAATVPAGPLIARYASRPTIIGAGAASVAALGITGFASDPIGLTVGLAVISAADVIQDVAMNVQATAISRRRRVPIMGRLHGLWSFGTLVGGFAASRLAATELPVSSHLVIVACLLAVATAWAVPRLAPRDDERPGTNAVGVRRRWRSAGPVLVLGALAIGLELVPADWAALRMVDDLGTAPDVAGLAFSVFVAGMLVGRLGSDSIVARLGPGATLICGAAVSAGGITMAMLPSDRSVSVAGFAMAGLGVAPVFPELYALAGRVPDLRPGTGIALLTSGQRIAALLIPAVVGGLAGLDQLRVGQAAALVAVPCAIGVAVVIGLTNGARAREPAT